MDPITHGVLGLAVGEAVFGKKLGRKSGLIGAIAAMAPDLDVFIQTAADPFSGLVYHRHFTHALSFIPVGALIVALLFCLVFQKLRADFKTTWAVATLSFATHSLLDSCTSYGTMLYWPFADTRVAWDFIAIIDLFFTLPLFLAWFSSVKIKTPRPYYLALIFCVVYMVLGAAQHQRAVTVLKQTVLLTRQHVPERLRATPTIGNLMVWNSVYEFEENLYLDRELVPLFGAPKMKSGAVGKTAPLVEGRALEIFNWFSDGYLGVVRENPLTLGDMRYVPDYQKFDSLWGLKRVDASGLKIGEEFVRYAGVADRKAHLLGIWRDFLEAVGLGGRFACCH